MGNASSKDRHDDTVDFGALSPQGIYTGPQDWSRETVGRLIIERKLAPFYRPLEDYEDDWDDEQILAARKVPPPPPPPANPTVPGHLPGLSQEINIPTAASSSRLDRPYTAKSARAASKEPQRMTEAKVYRGAVECPICFLYYPPNINHSRCCDQAICTECFVQIKRSEPTPTHLVSDPACCPYCVQENFGVVYTPPSWRTGIGSDLPQSPSRPDFYKAGASGYSTETSMPVGSAQKQRRKSMSHLSEDVVTTDQIRPDWQEKLEQVKAAVARRAQRRIIMRQVGDRLIPVGVTSGRIQALNLGEDAGEEGSPGRRSRRRNNGEIGSMLQSMGIGMAGQDLEELLLQEAMRLSLIEHEAEQKRQADEKRKQAANGEPSQENGAGPSNAAPETTLLNIGSSSANLSNPASAPSSRSVSPRPPSQLAVSSSPAAAGAAAVALGFGLPAATSSSTHLSASNLLPSENDVRRSGEQPRSPSHSRSGSKSHSHSRNTSQSTLPLNTFAAIAHASNVATTVASGRGTSPVPPPTRTPEPEATSELPPQLPVVISASDLFEDVRQAAPEVVVTNGAAAGASDSGPESLPTVVEGVTATPHVPSPNAATPVRMKSPVSISLPPSEAPSAAASTPSIVLHRTLSSAYTDGGSTEDEDESTSDSRVDYKILPSTPSLIMTEPLLSAADSIAGRSRSSTMETQ